MSKKSKPFKDRAKELINSSIKSRLFLIAHGKSKSTLVTFDDCKKVQSELEVLNSDKGFARYILAKESLLRAIIPANDAKNRTKFTMLWQEAVKILSL